MPPKPTRGVQQFADNIRLDKIAESLEQIQSILESKTDVINNNLIAIISHLSNNVSYTNSIAARIGSKLDQIVQLQVVTRQDLSNIAVGLMQRQDITNNLLAGLLNKDSGILTPAELLTEIRDELRSEADEGLGYTYTGTATTTLTVIDLAKGEPYHPVRGFTFKNTGATTIKFAINNGALAYRRSVDGSSMYNRSHPKGRPINKFFLQTESGSSTYELEVLW